MNTVRATIPIRVKAKDGAKGEKGDTGETGATGAEGLIWRSSEWREGYEYRCDEDYYPTDGGKRYKDIVVFTDSGHTKVETAYECIQTHTSSSDNKPGTSGASGYWKEASNIGGLVTPFIVAEAAFIENLTVGGMRMTDADGDVIFRAEKETAADGTTTAYVECNKGTFKNIDVESGTIGGWLINSNSLTNLDEEGLDYETMLSPQEIRFRDDAYTREASIGVSSSLGYQYLAKFVDNRQLYGSGATALLVGVTEGSHYPEAICMDGGYVSGFALKTTSVAVSTTLNRSANVVFLTNSAAITVTLPSMQICDEGHVIILRRLTGATNTNKVTIKGGTCEYLTTSGLQNILHTGGATCFHYYDATPKTDSITLDAVSDGYMLIYTRQFDAYTSGSTTYYGRWVVFKMVRDW